MLKLLSTLLGIQAISSILMKINGTQEKHCFSKSVSYGDTINVIFIVTGEIENEKTKAVLYGPKNELLYSEHSAEGEFHHDVNKSRGDYKLCFYPEQNREHYLSLEFYTKNEKGHLINMAKDGKKK
jgi:hypothetical protein